MFHFQRNLGCTCSYKIAESIGITVMGVVDTLVYISKESRKKRKRKKLLNFLKAASERKDKLTYDYAQAAQT